MAQHYKLWNELFDNCVIAAQAIVQRGGHLVLEWPSRCRYWKQPKVKALLGITDLGWKSMRVKACAHGQRILTGKDKGKALTKVWRLVSTINDLQYAMDIPCQGDHDHVTTIGGSRALLSGKYPDGFAKAFHQHYRNVVLNDNKSYTTCVIDLKTTSPQSSSSESLQGDNGTTIQASSTTCIIATVATTQYGVDNPGGSHNNNGRGSLDAEVSANNHIRSRRKTQESSACAEIYLLKVCLHLSCRQHFIQISIFYHYIIISYSTL